MSIRLYNCLKANEINTLGDILKHDIIFYTKIKGMGRTSIKELIQIVRSYGYDIKGASEI